jgi:hypothetical protein
MRLLVMHLDERAWMSKDGAHIPLHQRHSFQATFPIYLSGRQKRPTTDSTSVSLNLVISVKSERSLDIGVIFRIPLALLWAMRIV